MSKPPLLEDPFTPGYYESLAALVDKFKPKRGLEIGMLWGVSAAAFLETSKPWGGHLVSVDPINIHRVDQRLQNLGLYDRWLWIEGYSPEIFDHDPYFIQRPAFDWIYVDGEHTYQNANSDLRASLPLLSTGGILLCDDCEAFPEVGRAFREVQAELGWPMYIDRDNPHVTYYMLKP